MAITSCLQLRCGIRYQRPNSAFHRDTAIARTLAARALSGLQTLIVPAAAFRLSGGIAYGPLPRQRLDIYTPRRAPPRGTVLFVHGGSWTSGDRTLYRFLGQALAARGYQVVVPDYRLYPAARYPAFVEDTALAFAWTRAQAAAYGGDPKRIAVMGHSAGAYNVAMIALDPAWLAPHGLQPSDIDAVIALAGPLSFNPLKSDATREIFASAADIELARPIKLAAAGAKAAPPFLLIHGTNDQTVGDHNSRNMADALNAAGGRAELNLYPGAGHLTVVTAFAWWLRKRAPSLDDAVLFLDKPRGAELAPSEGVIP